MDNEFKNSIDKYLFADDSALCEFSVKSVSFDELLREYESTRPAKEYIPIAVAEEAVPVVIYGPGEEAEKPSEPAKKKGWVLPPKPRYRRGMITVGVFTAIILLTGIIGLFTPDKEFSQTENRTLNQRPTLSRISLSTGSFMGRFETYLSDQFPARDMIVSLKSRVERLFGKSEQNGVYVGRDGWLFEQQTKYDEKKVDEVVSAIKVFAQKCGIKKQMFALIPNSSYILSDYLPRFLNMDDQRSQIYSVYEKLPKDTVCIDVASVLLSYKNPQQLYYKTDHHWTVLAAKKAFNLMADEWNINTSAIKYDVYTASNSFYGTLASSSGVFDVPDTIKITLPRDSSGTYIVQNPDLQTKSTSLFEISKLKNQNQYEVFLGGNYSRIIISTTNRNSKSLLIFKDSYANCLIPMLTPYFQKIVIVDPRYFNERLSDVLDDEEFTHLLYLYNVNTFLEDSSLTDVLSIS